MEIRIASRRQRNSIFSVDKGLAMSSQAAVGSPIPFTQADAIMRSLPTVASAELVPLAKAANRLAALSVVAPYPLPRAARSAMDGYAFWCDPLSVRPDSQIELRITGSIYAGDHITQTVPADSCVAVTTGAYLPPGTNTVAPWEQTYRADDKLILRKPPVKEAHVIFPGEECRADALLLSAGSPIGPQNLAALAAYGYASVMVRRRLRVALLQTGSEIVTPGHPLEQGQVYNSSGWALIAALQPLMPEVVWQGVCADRETDVAVGFRDALAAGADVVLTTGGVSTGERDLVPTVCEQLGAQRIFWRVDMKPSKAIYAARKGETFIFGLSGNPHAALIGFYTLVRPALACLAGLSLADRCQVILANAVTERPNRMRILWANSIHPGIYSPLQGLSVLESMVQASGLILLPPRERMYESGEAVDLIRIEATANMWNRADAAAQQNRFVTYNCCG